MILKAYLFQTKAIYKLWHQSVSFLFLFSFQTCCQRVHALTGQSERKRKCSPWEMITLHFLLHLPPFGILDTHVPSVFFKLLGLGLESSS